MNRNYFVMIAGAALLCLLLIFISLWHELETPVTKDPIIPPNVGPYQFQISGIGIVEPSSENIYIGTPVNRVVEHVYAQVGEKVKKGQPLFSLENRDLSANLEVQNAAYASALARSERLKQLPQAEDLTAAKINLHNAKIAMESAKSQNEMVAQLPDQRAISQEEKNRRLYAYRQAEAQLHQAQASYAKIKAGVWQPDLEIAELETAQAKANVDLVHTEIERTTIRSPIDGTVLQVKIHDGELPSMDTLSAPLMVLGDLDEMHLRVNINQLDIPLFNPEFPATAYLQGDSKHAFRLKFVRMEPLLVNKQNLSNNIYEKVDTRVMQLIYRFENNDKPIYVGQQMDVYIETNRS